MTPNMRSMEQLDVVSEKLRECLIELEAARSAAKKVDIASMNTYPALKFVWLSRCLRTLKPFVPRDSHSSKTASLISQTHWW